MRGTMDFEMEEMNGSFVSLKGEIVTPAPYATLIKDGREFSRFLSDRTLFFDGRFAFYGKYESEEYYDEHDLIAVIVRGGHTLKELKKVKNKLQVVLVHTAGEGHTMYFITAPKKSDVKGVEIVV